MAANELEQLTVADAAEWGRWLAENHARADGVWLTLAKKGATQPTSLTYDQALEESLCFGWIDGQARGGDATSYGQRFTPRRKRSQWSQRNRDLVERLVRDGRMQPAGAAEIERARADGRWDAAYAGSANMEVPADFAQALARSKPAQAMFDILTRGNRYAVLYRVETAKRADTRARRIEQLVEMLERGETIHPQRQGLEG